MNNRVDYLSDRLVNLRGKHKSVDEVIPPESIANGVSIAPSPAEKKAVAGGNSAQQVNTAQQRRKEQTMQLFYDYEQRLTRRRKQVALRVEELELQISKLQTLQKTFSEYDKVLQAERFTDNEELAPTALGDRFRTLDRSRLEFFETEAELEMLMSSNVVPASPEEKKAAEPTDFKSLLKQGAALALTVGLTIAAAIIIAAVVLYAAWS